MAHWRERRSVAWLKAYSKVSTQCRLLLVMLQIMIKISLVRVVKKKTCIGFNVTQGVLCSKSVCSFLGSPPTSTEGSNRRLLVYEHCIPLCESGDLQTEVAADIIGLLMLEVNWISLVMIPEYHSEWLLSIIMTPLWKGSSNKKWHVKVKILSPNLQACGCARLQKYRSLRN